MTRAGCTPSIGAAVAVIVLGASPQKLLAQDHSLTVVTGQNGSVRVTYGVNTVPLTYEVPEDSEQTWEFPAGTQLELTATPAPGYRVLSWEGTDPGSDESHSGCRAVASGSASVTMNRDETVVVAFEKVPAYTIRLRADEGGQITMYWPIETDFGTQHTVPNIREPCELRLFARPDAGYDFVRWHGFQGDLTTQEVEVAMEGSMDIWAEFDPEELAGGPCAPAGMLPLGVAVLSLVYLTAPHHRKMRIPSPLA